MVKHFETHKVAMQERLA